MLVQTK